MEILFKLFVYTFLTGCFLLLPIIISKLSKESFKRNLKIKSSIIFILVIFSQIFILSIVYFKPMITYSNDISDNVIEESKDWVREKLEKPWKGFYSTNIPIIAYKFHITYLSNSKVVAEVHYLPFGNTKVQWGDGLYDMIKSLN